MSALGDPRPALAIVLVVALVVGLSVGVFLSRCVDMSADEA